MENMDNITKFVRDGVNGVFWQSKSSMKTMLWALACFNIFSIIFGLYSKGVGTIYAILSIVEWLSFLIFTIIMIKKGSYKNHLILLYNSGISVYLTTTFSTLALIFMHMKGAVLFEYLIFAVMQILPLILLCIFLLKKIKRTSDFINSNKKSKNKKTSRNRLIQVSAISGIAGIWLFKIFLSDMSQEAIIILCIGCLLFLSDLSSFGLINILKFHYLKKYNLNIIE